MKAKLYPPKPVEPFFPSRKIVDQTTEKFASNRAVFKHLLRKNFTAEVSDEAEINTLGNYFINALDGKVYVLQNKQDISELNGIETAQLHRYIFNRGEEQALSVLRFKLRDRRPTKNGRVGSIKCVEDATASISPEELNCEINFAINRVQSLSFDHISVLHLMMDKCGIKEIMSILNKGHRTCRLLMDEVEAAIID